MWPLGLWSHNLQGDDSVLSEICLQNMSLSELCALAMVASTSLPVHLMHATKSVCGFPFPGNSRLPGLRNNHETRTECVQRARRLHSLDFSPNGRLLVSASYDAVQLRNIRCGAMKMMIRVSSITIITSLPCSALTGSMLPHRIMMGR
jgi:hypothetical protein